MRSVDLLWAALLILSWNGFTQQEIRDLLPGKSGVTVGKKTVLISTRDKVLLVTDLYFPGETDKKFPVILYRTPHKKEMLEREGNYYARQGYVVAIQDCRGCFSSKGVWEPFVNEPKDGYDTIEWLGTQEWSTGKVGMISESYRGWAQLSAAAEKPPHLAAFIPTVTPPDPFYNIPYEYGIFFILGSAWWAETLESGDLSGTILQKISGLKYKKILKSLPVIDLDEKLFGRKNAYWRKWIENNSDDSYRDPVNFKERLANLNLPVFIQSAWFDSHGIGSKMNHPELQQSRRNDQKLILGPWGPGGQSRYTHVDCGPGAFPDMQTMYLRWFDYWLKGIDNDIVNEPLIQLFVMFANKWVKGNMYPLEQTRFVKYYLASEAGANTSRGDGRLQTTIPENGPGFDKYIYDPGDPTPSPDFYFKSDEEIRLEKEKTISGEDLKQRATAFRNQVTDSRSDILVYQTEALAAPVTIAGPISAILYASTCAADTDWFMTLNDVDENGGIIPVTHGMIRARYRDSTRRPKLLEKGKIYEYDIDMWQMGIQFQKGHRIRVEVSSALFPLFSRNLNTGKHNEKETEFQKAAQKIFHTEDYPSHVILPVINLDEMGAKNS